MQSEGDPKPFYTRRNVDGTLDEYVLQDSGSEVLHQHVTPPYVHHSGAAHVRRVQTWEAGEFYGENVPPGARLALQKIQDALQKLQEYCNAART
jgi:hypothetical protein